MLIKTTAISTSPQNNKNRSVTISLIVSVVIAIALFIVLIIYPKLIKYYFISYRLVTDSQIRNNLLNTMSMCFYPCIILAYFALYSLIKLLLNIKNDDIFIMSNVKHLGCLSWYCFGVCLITLLGVIFCHSMFALLVISTASGFIGMIIRVIKIVFEKAVKIQTENDLTI